MNVYLVGGAVRDKLLDRPIKERDYVVVGSTPNELMSLGYQQVGSDFPVFLHPQTHDEYALARTERKSGQGYTGFICDFTPDVTLEEDLIRRDLTVNAMAEDKEGTIIDPFNGQQDLHNKVLRHVSDAFSEDPVRILRVARFAARYHHLGFSIAPETLMLMKTMVAQGEINTLTKERVWLEIEKSLDDDAMHIFTDVLQQVDALTRLLPTLASYWSSEHSLTLAKYIKHVSQKNKRLIVFSLWLRNLSLIDVASLEEYLRIPNRYLDAVKNFVTFEAELSTGRPSVEGILELLSKTDSDRRPERLSLFLDTFSVLGNDQKVLADTLRNIAIQIRDIDVGSIIQMGFKGIEIKHQIELNKVRIIRAALSL